MREDVGLVRDAVPRCATRGEGDAGEAQDVAHQAAGGIGAIDGSVGRLARGFGKGAGAATHVYNGG